ncbi:MAG: gamma-glutamylcyclotransferase [Deltaproteobacteria bacterium]|nr:gamma-glutamylcyclotransferase [Deltaproteobacteria bacterium]
MPVLTSMKSGRKSFPTVVNLFIYGTLMDKSQLYQITLKHFPTSPAILKDYRKLISTLGYPYIVPSKGSTVDGLLIRNVDAASLKRLDEYEDESRLYFRKPVIVTSGGKKYPCEVYVGNEKILRPRS